MVDFFNAMKSCIENRLPECRTQELQNRLYSLLSDIGEILYDLGFRTNEREDELVA